MNPAEVCAALEREWKFCGLSPHRRECIERAAAAAGISVTIETVGEHPRRVSAIKLAEVRP